MSVNTEYPFVHWDTRSAGFRQRAAERHERAAEGVASANPAQPIPREEHYELLALLTESATENMEHRDAMRRFSEIVVERFPLRSHYRPLRWATGHRAVMKRIHEPRPTEEIHTLVPEPMAKAKVIGDLFDYVYELKSHPNASPARDQIVSQLLALARTPLL